MPNILDILYMYVVHTMKNKILTSLIAALLLAGGLVAFANKPLLSETKMNTTVPKAVDLNLAAAAKTETNPVVNENGYIEIMLDYGEYYLKEVETLDGYILSEQKYDVEITEQDQVIEIVVTNGKEIEVPKTSTNDLTYLLGGILVSMGIVTSVYELAKKRKN